MDNKFEKKTQVVSCKTSKNTKRMLQEMAAARKTTISKVMSEIIREAYLQRFDRSSLPMQKSFHIETTQSASTLNDVRSQL